MAGSEINDCLTSNYTFSDIKYQFLPYDKTIKDEKPDIYEFMSNSYNFLCQQAKICKENEKLSNENQNFRNAITEMKKKLIEYKLFQDEFIKDIEKIFEGLANIRSDKKTSELEIQTQYVNLSTINDINQTIKNDLNSSNLKIRDSVNNKKNLESFQLKKGRSNSNRYSFRRKKEEVKCGCNKPHYSKDRCKACYNRYLLKSNPRIANKCGCKKPHFALGLCRNCYGRNRYNKLPDKNIKCIACKYRKAMKAKKYCSQCQLNKKTKKPWLCDCNRPHSAKGYCRICYAKYISNYKRKIIKMKEKSINNKK